MTKSLKEPKRMLFTSNYFDDRQNQPIGAVRQHLAEAMVGKTVDLLSGSAVAHGIVSGVLLLAGSPKLLVNGRMYDLNQVLTASPA
ncbi:MAG TPA: hypothetical protein VH597_17355 [Verrucomicrobiae bacterium]|jgi:hypothetical protein|nr:hypothetical protein [Verrucomicrobiae bacterium]